MRKLVLISMIFAFVLGVGQLFAEGGEIMTNETVIKLSAAGLGEEAIVASMVAANDFKFATDPDSLIALKSAGVGDQVIATMIRKTMVKEIVSPTDNTMPSTTTSVPEVSYKWNGLELGVSTLADVKQRLEEPNEEEITSLKSYKVGKALLDDIRDQKIFLRLTYRPTKERSQEYREIIMYLRDDVLVAMILDPRDKARQDPQGLINYFEGVEFHDFVSGFDEGLSKGTGRYERLGDEVTVNDYGMEYAVWGKSDRSIIVLEVRQPKKNLFNEIGSGIFDKTDRRRPGKVHRVYFYAPALAPNATLAQN